MRSKAPLALMEQLVMLLVFALAATLCVQAFVLADRTSRQYDARDRAVLEAQNAAETLKSVRGDFSQAAALCGGSFDGQLLGWSRDENWEQDGPAAYHILVFPADTEQALLGGAQVTVYTAEGELLFSLPVAWQEVDSRG